MRRFLLASACMLATALSVPGPAFSQTLRISLRQDLDVLDPATSTTYVGRIVFAGLCDKLFDIDEKLNIVPQLATGYEWADRQDAGDPSAPGREVPGRRGTGRGGGEIHAGSLPDDAGQLPQEARSVRSTMWRWWIPVTVRVVLKSPSGAFLAQLTDRSGMILPPKATEAEGKDFAAHPVCSGPFKFVERVPQDHVTLERFADYWDAKDIHFDRVVYQVFADHRCGWPI